jgi:hypothetical protein
MRDEMRRGEVRRRKRKRREILVAIGAGRLVATGAGRLVATGAETFEKVLLEKVPLLASIA